MTQAITETPAIVRSRGSIKVEPLTCTIGAELSNVNIGATIDYHQKHGKLATVTAVQPVERYGLLEIKDNKVQNFKEKPKNESTYISGGFFVLSSKVFDLIEDDQTVWEKAPLETLAHNGELMAYKHNDFWFCVDTLRDKLHASQLWDSGAAPWKTW